MPLFTFSNIYIAFKKNDFSTRLVLHWGVFKKYPIDKWCHPNKDNYPLQTKEYDNCSLDTEFVDGAIQLNLPKNEGQGISFVFYNPDNNQWYNNNLNDFQIKFSH